MIGRSAGFVFALSVPMLLGPFSAKGQTPTPKLNFTPSPSTACALLAADFTTPISDGHEKDWIRLCNLAEVIECQTTLDYVQDEVHKSIPDLTCHGPK